MVFQLNISDMERHSVELRLFIEKSKRRFALAQMDDHFAEILRKQLEPADRDQNSISLDNLNTDGSVRCLESTLR